MSANNSASSTVRKARSSSASSTALANRPRRIDNSASSTAVGAAIDPRLATINERRKAAGLSHDALCRSAGINLRNYYSALAGRHRPTQDLLDRLEQAIGHERQARPPQIIRSYLHFVTRLVATAQGLDADEISATDFAMQRPHGPARMRAIRARMIATYIVAVELEIGNVDLAGVLGQSRQAVKKARDRVEDLRDDPTIDAVIVRVSRELKPAGGSL